MLPIIHTKHQQKKSQLHVRKTKLLRSFQEQIQRAQLATKSLSKPGGR